VAAGAAAAAGMNNVLDHMVRRNDRRLDELEAQVQVLLAAVGRLQRRLAEQSSAGRIDPPPAPEAAAES